jgi:hypothetical protein
MLTNDRIIAQNTLNGVANEIEGHLLRILSPYQGFKGRKISGHGGYVAKLQAEFHSYYQDHGYNQPGKPYWLNVYASHTTLVATVRDNTTTAKPVEMYLGRFDDETGILIGLSEGVKRRTDYTLEEVQQANITASQLEDQARHLRSSVAVFGRG